MCITLRMTVCVSVGGTIPHPIRLSSCSTTDKLGTRTGVLLGGPALRSKLKLGFRV